MLDDNDPIHHVLAKYTDNYKGLELSTSGEGRLGTFIEARSKPTETTKLHGEVSDRRGRKERRK